MHQIICEYLGFEISPPYPKHLNITQIWGHFWSKFGFFRMLRKCSKTENLYFWFQIWVPNKIPININYDICKYLILQKCQKCPGNVTKSFKHGILKFKGFLINCIFLNKSKLSTYVNNKISDRIKRKLYVTFLSFQLL